MKWLTAILFCMQLHPAMANTWRVAGTVAFEKTLTVVQAGDTILWQEGTYRNVVINFNTPVKSVVLAAAQPGRVILTGASRILINGHALQVNGFVFEGTSGLQDGQHAVRFLPTAAGCRLTQCAFRNYTPQDRHVNNNWIAIEGREQETDHCYLIGKMNQGPYLVVVYADTLAPRHHIHHNYFGKRSMPEDNGGEDMRIGDSKTSLHSGFNLVEHNYFEGQEKEAEVISNKSCDNVYRYNTFKSCDGALVLRHGNRCLVYGNYIDGKPGRGLSGGIRIIGTGHTVFNNYLVNLEGGNTPLKAPVTIMAGLPASPLNGYFAADSALVAFNTITDATGPAIRCGVSHRTRQPIMPVGVITAHNHIIRTAAPAADCSYTISTEATITYIRYRVARWQLSLTDEEISIFHHNRTTTREMTGTSW